MSGIVFAIAGQGVLLALILMVMESQRPVANRLLACILMTYSLRLVSQALFGLGGDPSYQLLSAFFANSSLLLGPLLYAYAMALMDDGFHLRTAHLKHLLPTALAVGWSLTDWAGYARTPDSGLIRISAVHGLCGSLTLALYCKAIFRRLHDYRCRLLDTHSAIERISLNWLRLLAGIILFVGAAAAVVNTVILITGWLLSPIFLVVMPLSVVLFYAVAICGFRQSSILLIGARPAAPQRPAAHADNTAEATAAAHKYARSGLAPETLQPIWETIENTMRERALYRDPDLDLAGLAQELGVATHTLSQVLNSHAGVRFYDYINGWRVSYAKQLLLDPRHQQRSVLDIALDAGFNTKSTFNKCFKQVVGETPSAYREQQRHSPNLYPQAAVAD